MQTDKTGERVVHSLEGRVLRITINRPRARNALSMDTLDEVADLFAAHAERDDVALAVLTGAGDKSFAAGGDLKELEAVKGEDAAVAMATRAKAALKAVREFPLPVVAGLNGDALGGGAELALACDMRIAASHARIGFIQGRLAITSAWGGGVDLIRLVGPAVALQMMARSEILSAPEARDRGLINQVAGPDQDLDGVLQEFIEPMAGQSPHVLRAFKALTLHARRDDRAPGDGTETRNFGKAWAHPDHDVAVARLMSRMGSK